jgi:RNA polymerase sigma-70 factor, ECF subfamily
MDDLDIATVEKARKGDKKAFDRVITTYRSRIIDLCYKYMRNYEEAVDMAQETFCTAYTSLAGFKGESKISTWLYRICVNLCINRLDNLTRRKYFMTDSMHADDEAEKQETQIRDTAILQDEALEAGELKDIIMKELESFTDEEKGVIILREMQVMEYEEISEILKIPLGSVKSKLSRAREKLKAKLKKRLGMK